MAKCTVCHFEINNANPHLTSNYQGQKAEFCCPVCKGAFDAAPEVFSGRMGAVTGAGMAAR